MNLVKKLNEVLACCGTPRRLNKSRRRMCQMCKSIIVKCIKKTEQRQSCK